MNCLSDFYMWNCFFHPQVSSLAVGQDCVHAILGCDNGGVYIYNLCTTELLRTFVGSHASSVVSVRIAQDQNMIFSASQVRRHQITDSPFVCLSVPHFICLSVFIALCIGCAKISVIECITLYNSGDSKGFCSYHELLPRSYWLEQSRTTHQIPMQLTAKSQDVTYQYVVPKASSRIWIKTRLVWRRILGTCLNTL